MGAGKTKVRVNRGAHLLKAWLLSQEMSYDAFAELVVCTKSYVGLLVNNQATPGLHLAVRIERETDGFIAPKCWFLPPPN